ncbi:hypothetical protein J6590_024305 [Homalodisca vitripennis]|nr:hypothetical protein J6590_024305 [Homalodisca vitripennis]
MGSPAGDESTMCKCGAVQDTVHLLVYPWPDQSCNIKDLLKANDKSGLVTSFWKTVV